MPENKNLKPVDLPMKLKWGEKHKTEITQSLNALKVSLVKEATSTRSDALGICWRYAKATWAESGSETDPSIASENDLVDCFLDVVQGRALPNPMECIQFTFLIEGLSTQEVTHLIRHRTGTFAA
jgi:thymidylate synthase (FAD)